MNIKSLRKSLIHSINNIEDETFLYALFVIIEGHIEYDYTLTKEQEKELDRRLKSIEDGTAKLISWEEVKKELKKKISKKKSNKN